MKILAVESSCDETAVSVVENAGDMIKSKYLKLEDRTIFNSDGKITKDECVQITSTCDLTDLKISKKWLSKVFKMCGIEVESVLAFRKI